MRQLCIIGQQYTGSAEVIFPGSVSELGGTTSGLHPLFDLHARYKLSYLGFPHSCTVFCADLFQYAYTSSTKIKLLRDRDASE